MSFAYSINETELQNAPGGCVCVCVCVFIALDEQAAPCT